MNALVSTDELRQNADDVEHIKLQIDQKEAEKKEKKKKKKRKKKRKESQSLLYVCAYCID